MKRYTYTLILLRKHFIWNLRIQCSKIRILSKEILQSIIDIEQYIFFLYEVIAYWRPNNYLFEHFQYHGILDYLKPSQPAKLQKKKCGGVYFWLYGIAYWMPIQQKLSPPVLHFSDFASWDKCFATDKNNWLVEKKIMEWVSHISWIKNSTLL